MSDTKSPPLLLVYEIPVELRADFNVNDPYKILGLEKYAGPHEIKYAFRRLARIHHPDINKNCDTEIFKKIRFAYDLLTDPIQKELWDEAEVFIPAGLVAEQEALKTLNAVFESIFEQIDKIDEQALEFNFDPITGAKNFFTGKIEEIENAMKAMDNRILKIKKVIGRTRKQTKSGKIDMFGVLANYKFKKCTIEMVRFKIERFKLKRVLELLEDYDLLIQPDIKNAIKVKASPSVKTMFIFR